MDNAVPKIEGHAAFYAHLKNGRVEEARIIGLENDRFVEKILLGRKYWEAPIITSRICGICPTIHNITSIRAIEKAIGVEPSHQTKELRKLMLCGQMIQSHSLHLYLLVLPDFVGASSSFELQKSHPELFQSAIKLKRYADTIIEVIGGRAVHPIASVAGGFKAYPTISNLKKLRELSDEALLIAERTLRLFASFEYPVTTSKSINTALHLDKEYAFYDGDIWSSDGDLFEAKDYTKFVYEKVRSYTKAKFATLKGKEILVGAIARYNLNRTKLDIKTKKLVENIGFANTLNNPFHNVIAQAIENYYFVSRSIELLDYFVDTGVKAEHITPPKSFGVGTAACEAPRGTLFHHYELDKDGFITKCDIVTPTVQSLPSLEADIKKLTQSIHNKKPAERNSIIEMLIRAYDPCITCATH